MKNITATRFLLLVWALLALSAPARAENAEDLHAHIRLIPAHSQVTGGEKLTVAIEQTMDPGWHTYWINPGDSGEPMTLAWTMPAGFTAGPLQWPVPEKVVIGPLASYGYHEQTTLLQDITLPQTLPAGPLHMSAAVDILVCKDICIPEKGIYEFDLNDGSKDDNSALITAAASHKAQDLTDWPVTFAEKDGNLELAVQIIKPDLFSRIDLTKTIDLLPYDWGVLDNTGTPTGEFKAPYFILRQKRGERPLTDIAALNVQLAYQDKDGVRRALEFKALPRKGAVTPAPADKNGMSLLRAILFAIAGGLILNLMPCVFPILSLKTLKLCNLSGKELKEARLHSLTDMAGILVSFAVLAAILIALRSAGQQVGWGFQLQNPLFVLPLAWLLFIIGLSLSGFFEFGANLANLGGKWAQGHGYAASFFTGVLAAIVATPCTAPFMGVAMGYALTQPPVITFIVLLALGFGLSLPFLFLSFVPASRARLPKPGPWMVTFRQFLAFPLYASAAWLVWVVSMQAGPTSVIVALAGGVVIAFAIWLRAKLPEKGLARFLVRLLITALLVSIALMLPYVRTMSMQTTKMMKESGDWAPFTAAGFATLQAGDDPIFVDMTAAWCITCKINESAVLNTMAIMDLFHAQHVQTIRGDWTNRNAEITAFLDQQGRNGVPLYVYYGPRDATTKQRPVAVVLPQLLTPGIVEKTIVTN